MKNIASSFRDPAGSVFFSDGVIFRTISHSYRKHYEHLMGCGLYEELTGLNYLIPHREENHTFGIPDIFKVITPEKIHFITYPQEWCFSQLKEAALLTLRIQLKALEYGMVLKDASPYNIQFRGTRAIWIDTLSFEIYTDDQPWIAYRQFCEQFFAPLVVMSVKDLNLPLLRIYPAGVPLNIAAKLIPWYHKIRASIFLNIELHQRLQRKQESREGLEKNKRLFVRKQSLIGHVEMLLSAISRLKPAKGKNQEWAGYYEDEAHTAEYTEEKDMLLKSLLETIKPERVIDLGANTGHFSTITSRICKEVVALEKDPLCLEILFGQLRKEGIENILPLSFDIMEPAPAAGWEGKERLPLWDRIQVDLVLGLAVLHHISIRENVPYCNISSLLSRMGKQIIIEYVPTEDPHAKKMLRYKSDLVERVSKEAFLESFSKDWIVAEEIPMKHSARILYHMILKNHE